jgi:glutathionyl-hydroquinone reductase
VTHWLMAGQGWTFEPGPGVVPDTVNGAHYLHEVYIRADPHYTGRVTVPVLWDKHRQTIVNNESADIVGMLNSAFDGVGAREGGYYSPELCGAVDTLNACIYDTVNNGVYKAGFATTQATHEDAIGPLFGMPDWLEARLSKRRLLAATGRPRPTGACSPPWCVSTRSMSVTSSATSGGWWIIRTSGHTRASSTRRPGSARRSPVPGSSS